MKTRLALLLVFALCLSLAACGNGNTLNETVHIMEDGSNHIVTQDQNGNIVQERVEHPDGSITEFVFQEDGSYCETHTDPDGTVMILSFGKENIRISETRTFADGTRYEVLFHENGNILSETRNMPDGSSQSFCFDAEGLLVSETVVSPDGSKTCSAYEYDGNGNTTAKFTTLPDGSAGSVYRWSAYKENGFPLEGTVTAPDGTIYEFIYDEFNRSILKTITVPDGTVTICDHNNIETAIGSDGTVYAHIYDENNNKIEEVVTLPDGSVIRHEYDAAGNHISETFYDPDGNILNQIIHE